MSETVKGGSLVRVSRAVREAVLDDRANLGDVPADELRDMWLVLDAYAADLRCELKKRGVNV